MVTCPHCHREFDEDDEEGAYQALRGGSWFNYGPTYFRCAYRISNHPSNHSIIIGFRVAKTVTEKKTDVVQHVSGGSLR